MSEPRTWVADVEEAETVAELLIAFRNYMGDRGPSDNAMLAGVEQLMENIDTEYLLGAPDDDSAPAAVAQLRFRHSVWTATPDCWLEDLFVRDGTRGRGLGSALVELTLERARRRGCRRIELDTNQSNVAALALYERFGFSRTSKGGGSPDLFLGRRLQDA